MRATCRISVLAVGICLLTIPAFSQNQQQETKPAQRQPAAELHNGEQATIILKIQQTEQAKEESKTTGNHRTDHRNNGWFGGWSLSDRIAGIASAAAFLQFIALVITIWVMVRNGRRQLRAYVFPQGADILEGMMLDKPLPEHRNEIFVIIAFKNTGQTPAYQVISWAQIAVTEPANEETLVTPKLENKFHTSIGADGIMPKTMWHGRALSDSEISDVNKQVKAIYLYGRIEYRDAFKKQRHTDFRLRYNGPFPPPKGVIFSHCEKGNDAN